MDPAAATRPVTLFYSYAHEDEALRDELRGHLKILERRGLLASWHDRQIVPGEDWHARIDDQLKMSDLVLLLVSKDFIESDYIFGTELEVAMQRHQAGLATVVPIIVRAINVEPEDGEALPFLKLQGLPTDLKPVTSWPNRDEAWTNVAKGLRATVKAIHERKAAVVREVKRSASRSGEPAAGAVPPGQPAPVGPGSDPVLDRVLAAFADELRQANEQRGGAALDADAVRAQALGLIDAHDQKRVLWVDDHPAGNSLEIAALAKLQIEVITASSTDAAMDFLDEDQEGIDLVISDWERQAEPPEAGLALLARIRQVRPSVPVVFYHRGFDAGERSARDAAAQQGGALGTAVYPGELMAHVAGELAAPRLSAVQKRLLDLQTAAFRQVSRRDE